MSLSQSELNCIRNPIDFTFCDIREYHQKHDENENPSVFSSPLWSKKIHSNYTCPSSPTTSMVDGRQDLMEINNTLPESCHELSLEDIVVKNSDNFLMMEERVDMKLELEGKKKSTKKGPISRSVSLDTGVFLLKSFILSSIGSKKHKASQSTSLGDRKKPPVDVKRRQTSPLIEHNNNTSSGSCNNGNCRVTPSKTRYGEGVWRLYGCLFTTSKPKNQKGCIFF